MSDEPRSAVPTLAAYASAHGLYHRAPSMALPQATQLLRHGFMREVPSLVRGDLPGELTDGWLAQVDYVYTGANDLQRSYFTLVLIEAPASLGFAVRVLCHDRGLSRLDMTNPDSEREIIETPDRAVKLESEAFLRRYALFTDADQDELSVWRLFAPSLIDWLTAEAPEGFSFELQDGALCCFVPGTLSADRDIDALCEASARVLREVSRIGGGNGALRPTAEGTRRSRVDEQLAEHPFEQPPKSIKAAAKSFRHGPFIGEEAWKLGAEAFFREHASAAGLERIEPGEFRSSHMDTFLPGVLAHVAKGPFGQSGAEAFLILTNAEDYEDMGWSYIVAAVRTQAELAAVATLPAALNPERGKIAGGTDGRSVFISTLDGGAQDRNAAELGAFLQASGSLLP
jgi:hypothetical protein